uniref:Uncharacterized protein n=1 Tax=Knipowitschia caucasica TaxID=637954 RepID=A0AAV2LPG4_KNICA
MLHTVSVGWVVVVECIVGWCYWGLVLCVGGWLDGWGGFWCNVYDGDWRGNFWVFVVCGLEGFGVGICGCCVFWGGVVGYVLDGGNWEMMVGGGCWRLRGVVLFVVGGWLCEEVFVLGCWVVWCEGGCGGLWCFLWCGGFWGGWGGCGVFWFWGVRCVLGCVCVVVFDGVVLVLGVVVWVCGFGLGVICWGLCLFGCWWGWVGVVVGWCVGVVLLVVGGVVWGWWGVFLYVWLGLFCVCVVWFCVCWGVCWGGFVGFCVGCMVVGGLVGLVGGIWGGLGFCVGLVVGCWVVGVILWGCGCWVFGCGGCGGVLVGGVGGGGGWVSIVLLFYVVGCVLVWVGVGVLGGWCGCGLGVGWCGGGCWGGGVGGGGVVWVFVVGGVCFVILVFLGFWLGGGVGVGWVWGGGWVLWGEWGCFVVLCVICCVLWVGCEVWVFYWLVEWGGIGVGCEWCGWGVWGFLLCLVCVFVVLFGCGDVGWVVLMVGWILMLDESLVLWVWVVFIFWGLVVVVDVCSVVLWWGVVGGGLG